MAATQLQRIHTPESYAVDFQPNCDGERGRSDARYQYQRAVHSPLRAFCRGPRSLSVEAAYANSSTPRDHGTTVRQQSGPWANRLRSFFIRKKGVNSKQKVFSAMGSHRPGAYHLMTSFAVEQSVTLMSEIGPAHASSFNQIPSMRHQSWTFAQDHVLPGFFGGSQ